MLEVINIKNVYFNFQIISTLKKVILNCTNIKTQEFYHYTFSLKKILKIDTKQIDSIETFKNCIIKALTEDIIQIDKFPQTDELYIQLRLVNKNNDPIVYLKFKMENIKYNKL